MSFVVVSSHESVAGKDLQQPGESVAVHASADAARQRYASRLHDLTIAARARATASADAEAGSIAWVVLLQLPVPADDVDEALETLEILIEETDDVVGELDDLVVDYSGTVYSATGESAYARERAIDNLHAWLS